MEKKFTILKFNWVFSARFGGQQARYFPYSIGFVRSIAAETEIGYSGTIVRDTELLEIAVPRSAYA